MTYRKENKFEKNLVLECLSHIHIFELFCHEKCKITEEGKQPISLHSVFLFT